MDAFQIFTIIGITITALLGILNFIINQRSQRKTHRELIFQKQFDFFMKLQTKYTVLINEIYGINNPSNNLEESKEIISDILDEIDDLISDNEMIIPDELYNQIDDFQSYCNSIFTDITKQPELITREEKRNLIKTNTDLIDSFRNYIGVEKLSKENRDLVAARRLTA
jgi:hypothetical protein